MMSDDQHYFEQLQAADPAASSTPDLAALKARVLAHRESNVVVLKPRGSRLRALRYAAAAAVVVIAAGGGYLDGISRPVNTNTLGIVAPGLGLGGGGPVTGTDSTAAKGAAVAGGVMMPYGGAVAVLEPTSTVPNSPGEQASYRFDSKGVDRLAVAKGLAKLLGLPADYLQQAPEGSVALPGDTHVGSVYVGFDAMTNFNAWSSERSPWNCGQEEMSKVKQGAVKPSAPSSDAEARMREIQQQCDAQWPAPSSADALAAAKAALTTLDLPANTDLRLKLDGYEESPRSRAITGTLYVDGEATTLAWSMLVSKLGVYSINGFASPLVRGGVYPVVGARDAASRTALRVWSAFGPTMVSAPGPIPVPAASAAPSPSDNPTHLGRTMLRAGVSRVSVASARPALSLQWLANGDPLLMPAWDYTAADGSVWQMIAITEDYIDWTAQPYSGAIAYDAAAGSQSGASGVASAAGPMK